MWHEVSSKVARSLLARNRSGTKSPSFRLNIHKIKQAAKLVLDWHSYLGLTNRNTNPIIAWQ